MTDTSYRFIRHGGIRPITKGGEVITQLALMAEVERLFGRAGVRYRIRYYHKRISQRDRRSITADDGTGTCPGKADC